jgi:transcription elongation GreA/GreB family factor
MSAAETPAPMTTDQIEERFLAALAGRPYPVPELIEMLAVLDACGQVQRRDDCALVLQETFAENGERDGLIRMFELRCDWVNNRPAFGTEVRETLLRTMRDRMGEALLDSVGFGTVPPRECLRRLQVLLACQPGASCLDRTWGFGVVQRLDHFYRRVTVDFERRPNHAMTFAYAAEVLRLVDKTHILAVRHADREAFDQLARTSPAEIVRMALRSLGPMSVSRMEEEFRTAGLLPASVEWKSFWTSARSALKHDPLVKIPPATRKNEPVELLTKAVKLGDAAWFEELATRRDVSELLTQFAAIEGMTLADNVVEKARAVLVDRMQFVLKATETTHDLAAMARAVILAAAFGLDGLDLPQWVARVSQPEFVLGASARLPAREIERLIALIPLATNADVALAFVDVIPEMPYALVDAMMPLLLRGVAADDAKRAVREEFSVGSVAPALLLWLARHQSETDVQALIDATTVATQCLTALDAQESGERLRLQHQVARRFEDFGWLEGMAARMDDVQRQALNERIHATEDAWEPATKRSILGHQIKLYPELAERRVTLRAGEEAPKPRLTSWRSYNERLEQRRKLIEEDLPANSHDIAVARSYGDLRENFEYQSAKDTQRLLLQRQSELDADIKAVKATDFAALPVDKVGMGTTVTVLTADGKTLRYHVLGEWDSDESLGIIPNRSRVAEALEGRIAGATVMLPTAEGDVEATVQSVEAIPAAIMDWVMGRDLAK